VAFTILSFYRTRDPAYGLGDDHSELRDVDSFVDAPGSNVGRASDGSMRMHVEREGDRRVTNRVARRWSTEVPTGSASSDEGERNRG
jgi:hypothetical protein